MHEQRVGTFPRRETYEVLRLEYAFIPEDTEIPCRQAFQVLKGDFHSCLSVQKLLPCELLRGLGTDAELRVCDVSGLETELVFLTVHPENGSCLEGQVGPLTKKGPLSLRIGQLRR